MSRTTDHVLNTERDRADDAARELARLRDVMARAAAMLDEGGPAEVADECAENLDFAECWDAARDLRAVATTIREAHALLAGG